MPKYAVIDVETTGLSPLEGDRVIEIAAVFLDAELKVETRFESLLSINGEVDASDIHGLYASDLVGAPTFAEIAPALGELLAERTLVAHYPRFDLGFLESELNRIGCALPTKRVLDTRDLARAAGVRGSLNLAACCSAFGIINHAPHSAKGDANAAAEILRQCSLRGIAIDRYCVQRHGQAGYPGWPNVSAKEHSDVSLLLQTRAA